MENRVQAAARDEIAEPFIRPTRYVAMNFSRSVLAASLLPAAAGVVLFGRGAAAVIVFAAMGALLGEVLLTWLTQRRVARRWECSLSAGILLAFTLHAEATCSMALLGGVVSSAVGYGLFGGYGNHLWHPALVGRVAVQIFYGAHLTRETYGLLGRGHLLWGDLTNRWRFPPLSDWWSSRPPIGTEAWEVVSPLTHLLALGDESRQLPGDHPMMVMIRDDLPDWDAVVLGLTGGGIGETCIAALLAAGLWLMYRGVLRWELPVAVLAGGAVAVAVLPLRMAGAPAMTFFPGLIVWNGVWLGGIYVSYHLICGELMLCAMLLTADSVTTPLTRRGQIIFGAAVGILTIVLRLRGIGIGSCYWAFLLMNTLVPVIDRWTKRRVLGT